MKPSDPCPPPPVFWASGARIGPRLQKYVDQTPNVCGSPALEFRNGRLATVNGVPVSPEDAAAFCFEPATPNPEPLP